MDIPYKKGVFAAQAHVNVPDGTFEEEFARNGFFGKYAHLYRARPPVEWTRIEGSLRPRAYDLMRSNEDRTSVLSNSDVEIFVLKFSTSPHYWFRNADADELYFVHEGAGDLDTDFGRIAYRKGDYLLLPRGTVYRFEPAHPSWMLGIQSFSEIRFPDRGMIGQHALFDPAVIRTPEPNPARVSAEIQKTLPGQEFELRVQRMGEITRVFYPTPPITTLGWKGTLSVIALNVADIRPISSDRYHLPPSAHTTFLANGFVVCSFLPRPLENGDPGAMKVPFYHSNIDFDEVLFYHAGDFFSRKGISPGMVTFHPQGIHHGPQPGAEERTSKLTRTEEIAIMIDTQRPLIPSAAIESTELPNYWQSWRTKP